VCRSACRRLQVLAAKFHSGAGARRRKLTPPRRLPRAGSNTRHSRMLRIESKREQRWPAWKRSRRWRPARSGWAACSAGRHWRERAADPCRLTTRRRRGNHSSAGRLVNFLRMRVLLACRIWMFGGSLNLSPPCTVVMTPQDRRQRRGRLARPDTGPLLTDRPRACRL